MIKVSAEIHGHKELEKSLDQLPIALRKDVILSALIKVSEPVKDQARQHVPVDDGDLRDSIAIGTKLSDRASRSQKKVDYPQVFVGPTFPKGAHGHLVEFGTASHDIVPKKGGVNAFLVFIFGGESIFVTKVKHPGAKAQPFLRPAWDSTSRNIPKELGKILWVALLKKARTLANKAGKGTLASRTRDLLRS